MPAGELGNLKRAAVVVSLVGGIIVFLWWAPALVFHFVVAAVVVLATHELYAMLGVANSDRVLHAIGLAGAAALVLQMAFLPAATLTISIPLLLMIVFSTLAFRTRGPDDKELEAAIFVLIGTLYMPITMGQIIFIRSSEHGRELVAIVVATIFIRETSAQLAGLFFPSSRPLNASINKQKSYAGAVIGAVTAAAGALLVSRYLIVGFTIVQALVFGACLGVACQLGDLSESYLKRVAGLRHSGTLLGPEGGVLDFLDAAAFAIVTARLLLLVWGFPFAGRTG